MAPTTMSSDGVQMYIKQSAGGSASSPSYASYAPSIRQPPRSESFESLLELSVLASDLLEGGHTDLESEQEHCQSSSIRLWLGLDRALTSIRSLASSCRAGQYRQRPPYTKQ